MQKIEQKPKLQQLVLLSWGNRGVEDLGQTRKNEMSELG